jgi:hypothetical protein
MFSVEDSEAPKKGKQYDKTKLEVGRHSCKVVALKEHVGNYGHGFFLEFEVVDGPSPVGKRGTLMIYPENATGQRADGSQAIPRAQAVRRERGRVRETVAAVMGYTAEQASFITNEIYQAVVTTPERPVPSPMIGRLVDIDAFLTKSGKVAYNALPNATVTASIEIPATPAAVSMPAPTPAAAPPAVPAAPVAPSFPPYGWKQHPTNPAYYYCGQEVLTEEQLRARA